MSRVIEMILERMCNMLTFRVLGAYKSLLKRENEIATDAKDKGPFRNLTKEEYQHLSSALGSELTQVATITYMKGLEYYFIHHIEKEVLSSKIVRWWSMRILVCVVIMVFGVLSRRFR